MLHLLGRYTFRDGFQRIFVLLMLLAALMLCYGNRFFFLGRSEGFRFVEQNTELLHYSLVAFFRGCTEPLVLCKTEGFHEDIDLFFQL